jgi:preprotein translocase subunit SecA
VIKKALENVFGTRHTRELKRIQPILAEIHGHGDRLQQVSEDELRAQTEKFRSVIRERTH